MNREITREVPVEYYLGREKPMFKAVVEDDKVVYIDTPMGKMDVPALNNFVNALVGLREEIKQLQ